MLDFVNWKKIAPLDEIFERWNKLGMLEGLEEEQAKNCAYYFEYMATWISELPPPEGGGFLACNVKNDNKLITNDDLFSLVVFPAIKKIVISNNGFNEVLFDCQKIYDLYKKICYNELMQKDEEIVLQMFDKLAKK